MHRTNKPLRKAEKGYTLSLDSVRFLEDLRKRHRARSTSSVLDENVQAFYRSQRKKALAQNVSQYYSSLSLAEVEEDAARWSHARFLSRLAQQVSEEMQWVSGSFHFGLRFVGLRR
jgi:hypothetical protein